MTGTDTNNQIHLNGILRLLYTNNIAVVIPTKEPLKMSLIQARNMLGNIYKNCVK
jgi:hypothetical protein